MFWQLKGAHPDAIALIAKDGSCVTYAELSARADDWSDRLRSTAGTRSAIVAVEIEPTPESIGAYLGALRAGIPVLLLEPSREAEESGIAEYWQPEIIVRSGEVLASPKRDRGEGEGGAVHPDLSLLLSTSGTTGDPKLVRLSAGNIASNAEAIVEYLGITGCDRAITSLPLFYSYGLSVLNSYLQSGATIVLTDRKILDPEFWSLCESRGVTSLALVPHQVELLAAGNLDRLALSSLRYVTQAGGKLSSELATTMWEVGQSHGWDLFIMYGQTEASPRMSYVPPRLLPEASDTIGIPIPGGKIDLIGPGGKAITEPNVAGELVYRGPNVMMGYAERREDLARDEEVSALDTGDIAELTEDGLFRIVGRKKRFAKLFGLRISLDRTEEILRQKGIPAFVIAVDESLVVLHREAQDGPKARHEIEDAYGLPTDSVLSAHLDDVPLAPSGKPDMRAMAAIAEQVVREKEVTAVGDQSIRMALARATKQSAVEPGDSFNSLGGDSLSYIQMQFTLEENLSSVPDDWADMTLEQLEALATEQSGGSGQLTSVPFDIVLRILAITLVVAQHASNLPLYGGVWMLIALMGASAERFQKKHMVEGKPLLLAWRMLYPIIPAYFLLLLLYSQIRSEVPLEYLFLVGNYYVFSKGSLLTAYWFVSFYAQVVFLLALIAAIPKLRSVFAKSPFIANATMALFLIVGIAIFDLLSGLRNGPYIVWPVKFIASHGFFQCLPIFLIGWCLSAANSNRSATVALLLAAAYIVYFYLVVGGLLKIALLAMTFVAIWHPLKLRLPFAWYRHAATLASATLFVYLLHPVVVHITNGLQFSEIIRVAIAIAVSFFVAVVAQKIFAAVESGVVGSRWYAKSSAKADERKFV